MMDWSLIEFDNQHPKSIKRGQRILKSAGLLHNSKESADLEEKYVNQKGGWSTTRAIHLTIILGKALAQEPTCINLALLLPVFSSVWISGALLTLERLTLPGLAISKRQHTTQSDYDFTCKPTNLKPTPPMPSCIQLLHSGPLSTCPNHPGAKYQTTIDSS